jgi:hypothetical protein
MDVDEQTFRELLDERGILRVGACTPPSRSSAFTVFAQRTDARLDIDAIRSQASTSPQ